MVLFISLPHFWFICKWSLFSLPSCAYSTCNFTSPTPNFCLIRAVCFLFRQILSRRQHAPNKWCALNNKCAPDNPILRYACDLLVSFPDTFSLVPECLGMRLVSCAFVRIFIRATDELYCCTCRRITFLPHTHTHVHWSIFQSVTFVRK